MFGVIADAKAESLMVGMVGVLLDASFVKVVRVSVAPDLDVFVATVADEPLTESHGRNRLGSHYGNVRPLKSAVTDENGHAFGIAGYRSYSTRWPGGGCSHVATA